MVKEAPNTEVEQIDGEQIAKHRLKSELDPFLGLSEAEYVALPEDDNWSLEQWEGFIRKCREVQRYRGILSKEEVIRLGGNAIYEAFGLESVLTPEEAAKVRWAQQFLDTDGPSQEDRVLFEKQQAFRQQLLSDEAKDSENS